ncbi:MAG: beta-lactamase family protein [Clostridia bacterium]|nr:beta-lactamase family protein [Clostridia bacterium]
MPSTPLKNLLYRAALPLLAPSPHKQMKHLETGKPLAHLPYYEHLLVKHRVLGASLLLSDGRDIAQVHTTVYSPRHVANENTLFRVASITKMATALVTLMCVDEGLFSLDSPIRPLLPETEHSHVLDGMTVHHLLCHTSGLQDTPAMDKALREGGTFVSVLAAESIRSGTPGKQMEYCNFGFGLLGCLLENVTGMCISELFRVKLFEPLGMRATLDASTLDESCIMPISRVLPYKKGNDVTITKLGRVPLDKPDPLRHFGHTAGAMYTDAPSLSRLLDLIGGMGMIDGKRLVSAELMAEMTRVQSSTPTRTYGLGLVLLNRPGISERRLLGHQGFAYGCVDGAFIEEDTGRKVVFLNGGASEAREGKLGLVNKDVLTWAFRKEFPEWM